MAVDGNSPDTNAQMLRMQQALVAASQAGGGEKGMPLLAGLLPGGAKSVNVGSGLSIQAGAFKSDNPINRLPQSGKRGILLSLLDGMGLNRNSLHEDFAKVGQGAGVMYSGDVPAGAPVDSGLHVDGGSFTAMVGGKSDIEIG